MKQYAYLILLCISFSLSAQDYYLSNSLAMEMEFLGSEEDIEIDQVEWLLKIEQSENQKISILYKFGEEQKVFSIKYNSRGTMLYYSEAVDGILIEETDYDRDGRIQESRLYNKDGTIDYSSLYHYDKDGVLLNIEKKDESGEILSFIDYHFRDDGSIRSFFEYKENSLIHREIWNSFNGELSMELKADDSIREVAYYNDFNKVDSLLRYDGDLLVYEEKYHYFSNGLIEKIKKTDYRTSLYITVSMNSRGLISREEHFQKKLLLFSTLYYYSGDNLVKREKTGSGMREKWLFSYKNEQISEEVYYKQGVLIQKKKYTDPERNSYTIELFNKGTIFMNLIYEDDVKIREEFLKDGEIIRSRDLGDL